MGQEQYKNHSLEELATDKLFRDWTLYPTQELDAFWSSFLKEYPHKKILVQNARILVQGVQDRFHQDLVDRATLERYFEEVKKEARNGDAGRMTMLASMPVKIAAAIAVLIIAGGSVLFFLNNPQIKLYQTAYGERLKVVLPDGSVAELNANSQLKVRKAGPGEKREVWLNGEAFFSVEKIANGNVKFIVHTQGLDIEVLGTQFNVNTRRDNTQVLLEEGQVRLLSLRANKKQQKVDMNPGELAAYSKKTGQITKTQPEQTNTYLSWKDGYLIYDKATIGEIVQDIEATYGLDVRLTDSLLLEKTIRGALPTDNFDEFLEMVETLFDVEASRSGNQILLEQSID